MPIEDRMHLLSTIGGPASPDPLVSSEAVKTETVGEQIDRWRTDCRWSEEDLADRVGLDVTTVSRHIRGDMKPSLKNIGKYERELSKHLDRKIVIQNTPRKRP